MSVITRRVVSYIHRDGLFSLVEARGRVTCVYDGLSINDCCVEDHVISIDLPTFTMRVIHEGTDLETYKDENDHMGL